MNTGQSSGEETVTIMLRERTAEWLEEEMGKRAHGEEPSREIWKRLREELYGESFA